MPELTAFAVDVLGEPPYRARQLYQWIHKRRATQFDAMTSLSKTLRARLERCAAIPTFVTDATQKSTDGTVKFRLRTGDGKFIESVYLPSADRKTLCVSTQVGCAMGCRFCATARLGFQRHLDASEIVGQVHLVNSWLVAQGERGERPLTNLVFMGMGEPLHNFANVISALDILVSKAGPDFSPRHITVSTSGLVPQISAFAAATKAKLAISLNASDDDTRSAIMPVNRKWKIADLLAAVRQFPSSWGREVTFEYVLLGGLNDTEDDAKRLCALLSGIEAKVNLIPFNPTPPSPFETVTDERARQFREILQAGGIRAFIRENRGADIAGACGQLAGQPANA